MTGTTLGTTTSKHAFSGFGELSHTSAAVSGTPLFGQTIAERDALGRITHLQESAHGTLHDITYGYDSVGRLTKQTRDGIATTYGYDTNGNRLSVTVGTGSATTAVYDAQGRIQAYGTAMYRHDDHGDRKLRTEDTKSLWS